MSRILQFMCKLNTHRIAKTSSFCFLRNYYGDSLEVMFPQFPKHFLMFHMVFLHVSISVSTISLDVSTVSPVSYFRFCNNVILHIGTNDLRWKYESNRIANEIMNVAITCKQTGCDVITQLLYTTSR